jgi:fido (protein-threonine AMPylation protein)
VDYWHKEKVYPPDELAVRFHHKLVWIHCYPNGNGRHSRLATELGGTRFSWGISNLDLAGDVHRRYIEAFQRADQNDFSDLLVFARS